MSDPEITPEIVAAHGLNPGEWQELLAIMGREPTITELGVFSAMWNEHCSYKSSKKWLRTLPTTGPQVICGPGENAGVVDIGDGLAVVFKMESHNHPSFLDPHNGAATGVGGILRDVFTMGARPLAAMNALSFGAATHPKTPALLGGVVDGIAEYGNTFGVPAIGGELRFHASYDGNCLVNAFAAGIVEQDAIFYAAASGVGMPVVYVGLPTGRDGVGGATMASAEFDDETERTRPTAQVGDPDAGRRLMEACLELMAMGGVIAIQDMGAAGLTCSAVEMGDKGGLGIRLDLARVPQRDPDMTAYEMMLSETQERMLLVLDPAREDAARAILSRWDLRFAIVGETLAEDRFLVQMGNEVKADIPLSKLSSHAPEYDRPWTEPAAPPPLPDLPAIAALDALRALISSPNYGSRRAVIERYDSHAGGNTLVAPGHGAGVVGVPGTAKALAFTSDVTPRYVAADARAGGQQAVAEAYRNLCARGARPLACTDNLNFGNPEKPEIMGQLVLALKGISDAARALDMPIVSGNVSLYNETDGEPILPTPTIGAVGLLNSTDEMISGTARPGDILVMIGDGPGHLGQSALAAEAFGIEAGPPPPVDLAAERRHGEFLRAEAGLVRAATDLADGGLALASFELAKESGTGLTLAPDDIPALFGEDQARYIVALAPENEQAFELAASAAGVPVARVGHFGGDDVVIGADRAPMAELVGLHQSALKPGPAL